MTVTEALAELKTLHKRMLKKRKFILEHVVRPDFLVDPLEGGSEKAVTEEKQAFDDLSERVVKIRTAINARNAEVTLTVDGETRTVAEWIVWRREVVPQREALLSTMQGNISRANDEYRNKVVQETGRKIAIVAHYDEQRLAREIEHLETVLGDLDGKLSMMNATTSINE